MKKIVFFFLISCNFVSAQTVPTWVAVNTTIISGLDYNIIYSKTFNRMFIWDNTTGIAYKQVSTAQYWSFMVANGIDLGEKIRNMFPSSLGLECLTDTIYENLFYYTIFGPGSWNHAGGGQIMMDSYSAAADSNIVVSSYQGSGAQFSFDGGNTFPYFSYDRWGTVQAVKRINTNETLYTLGNNIYVLNSLTLTDTLRATVWAPGYKLIGLEKITGTLFTAGTDRIYVSNNDGSNWSFLNWDSSIEITDIDSHKNILFVATKNHGVLYSTNKGASFLPLNNFLPFANYSISSIAINTTTNELFATIPIMGVFKLDLNNTLFNNINLAGVSSNICQYSSIHPQFVNTTGIMPTSYSWQCTGAIPSSSTNLDPGEFNFPNAGVYSLVLVVSTSGAPAIYTQTITVEAAPANNQLEVEYNLCQNKLLTILNSNSPEILPSTLILNPTTSSPTLVHTAPANNSTPAFLHYLITENANCQIFEPFIVRQKNSNSQAGSNAGNIIGLCSNGIDSIASMITGNIPTYPAYGWWSTNDGVTFADSNSHATAISVSPLAYTNQITWNVTYGAGCAVSSNSTDVIIQITPAQPIIVNNGNGILSAIPDSAEGYRWRRNGIWMTENTSSILITQPGLYTVQVLDYFNGTTTLSCASPQSAVNDDYLIGVKGFCYIDYNNNSIYDAGDTPAQGLPVTTNVDTLSFICYTNTAGNFVNPTTIGSNNTFTSHQGFTIIPVSYTHLIDSINTVVVDTFALQVGAPIEDLSVSIIPYTQATLGNIGQLLIINNTGNVPLSGVVSISFPATVSFTSATTTPDSIVGNTLYFTTPVIGALNNFQIALHFNVLIGSNFPGDLLSYVASLSAAPNETILFNNTFTLVQVVLAAFDPNDKEMLGGTYFTTQQLFDGEYFNYLIRFQNIGNAPAINVVINDTLDSQLDFSTFQQISSSHNNQLHVFNNHILKWYFHNIMLPDSATDQLGSNGFVAFKIKPFSNLQSGDIVKNKAAIYFDINLPIITNEYETTIVTPTLIQHNYIPNDFAIFPNPANNQITLKSKEGNIIQIIDAMGKMVYQKQLISAIEIISIESLSKGIYTIRIGASVQNFIKN